MRRVLPEARPAQPAHRAHRACLLGALALVLVLIVGAGREALAANGPALSTIGAKGPVSIPVDGDAMTAYRMPSSIGWALDNKAELDLFLFFSRTTLKNNLNDASSTGTTPGGNLLFIFAPGRPDFDENPDAWDTYSDAGKFTFHVGEYVELAGGGSGTPTRSTAFPGGVETGTGITFLTTAISVAYTPTEWLSIGVAAHIIYASLDVKTLVGGDSTGSLDGSPEIAGVPLPGNPTYADFLELFSNSNASDPTTGFEMQTSSFQFTGVISISLRPAPNFGIGIAYTPRSYAIPFEDEATIDTTQTFNQAVGDLDPAIQDLFFDTLPNDGTQGFESKYDTKIEGLRVPRRIRGNVVWWPIPELLLSFEIAWVEWSRAFEKANVTLRNGTNQDVNFVVGSRNVNSELTLRFSNQFIYSFYTAYAVNEYVTLRFGLNYGRSPLNVDETGNSPSAGFVDINVSTGVGFRYDRFEVNLLTIYGVRNRVSTGNEPDSLTAKNSDYTSEQLLVHLGFGVRF